MLKLLRSGDEGALLQAYEEDQRYLQFQPCHGRTLETLIIIAREINLPWVCGETNPALIRANSTSMIKRC